HSAVPSIFEVYWEIGAFDIAPAINDDMADRVVGPVQGYSIGTARTRSTRIRRCRDAARMTIPSCVEVVHDPSRSARRDGLAGGGVVNHDTRDIVVCARGRRQHERRDVRDVEICWVGDVDVD